MAGTEKQCAGECPYGDRLGRMEEREARMEEKLGDVHNDVRGLLAALNGNGAPGIRTRLALAEERLAGVSWLGRTAMGAAIVALIGLVIKFLG